MSKQKSIRPKRTLFDNGRQGTKALRKRRLLFESLEIRTTVSNSLLGLLGAGALLPDAPFAAEPETEFAAGGAKSKGTFSSRETDALLADFLEGDSVDTLLGEATGEASAAAAPGPVATASTADSESVPAPREHGLIEPLQVALPGEDGSLAELDLAAMALLGGSGGSGGPPPNYPPVANDDTYETKHDSTRYVAQSMGVLYNDTDPNYGTVLSASLVSGPSHAASFTFNANGSFTYTPASGFVGSDTFVYRASDGSLTDDAQVTINVWNVTPTATNDLHETKHDTQRVVAAPGVLTNDTSGDGDPMTAVLVSGPSHAQSFALNADGSFSYTPAYHFVGTDTFTYSATDGLSNSPPATVSISVFNLAPTTQNDTYMVKHDTQLAVAGPGVKGNDSSPDGDPTTAILVSGPSHAAVGGFHFNADGSFDYTSAHNYVGTDSFTYKLNDGITDSATATVTINVIEITPSIQIVAVDTVAKELSPNELLQDDVATFLLTRSECRDHDIIVHLDFSGTADREDYQLEVGGVIVTDSVVMQAGWDSLEVTLKAKYDDMTMAASDPPETVLVEIAPSPDGSYLRGQSYSQVFSLIDTSTWKDVATNGQQKPFGRNRLSACQKS